MSTNRDDFVIAIRSAFLKKQTQQRFSLVSLIILSIFFLILETFNYKVVDSLRSGIKELVYRSSYIVTGPEKFIKNSFSVIYTHINHYKEYEEIRYELAQLKTQDLSKEIIQIENKKLKKLIDDYFTEDNELIAKVLIDKNSPFLRSVIINKGSRDNIRLGMAVLDEKYLVGKIVEVNYLSSRVLLLSDLNSKIPVSLDPGDVQAIMSGTGENNGVLQYSRIENLKDNNEEILVYTSGSGNLFKSGIPIGKINNKNLDKSKEKVVNFFKDFSQLKYVRIMSFAKEKVALKQNNQDEINQLNDQILGIKKERENFEILVEKKKIVEDIRARFEAENTLLKKELIKLEKRILELKEIENKNIVSEKELRFLQLNLIHSTKCKKTIFNKLYKVGTVKYRECILNKGKNN
tara:strand:- start:2943 stop:4160 length:1218 start_codon:yes stop_codon:yes gene_type:complete